jgi:hypothetical protein
MKGRQLDIVQFQRRLLQDCLSEAIARWWLNRATAFEAAAPRPGDFNGRATAEELAERRARCLATAAACRRHAKLLHDGMPEEISSEVRAVLAEVA